MFELLPRRRPSTVAARAVELLDGRTLVARGAIVCTAGNTPQVILYGGDAFLLCPLPDLAVLTYERVHAYRGDGVLQRLGAAP